MGTEQHGAGRHVRSGGFVLAELAALRVDPAGLAARGRALVADADTRRRGADRLLVGLQVLGNVTALSLSVLSWVWLHDHGTGRAATSAGPAASRPEHLVAAIPAPTLVLLLLFAGALLAPSVNPFYAGPQRHRVLHRVTVGSFAVLAATAVSVVAAAGS